MAERYINSFDSKLYSAINDSNDVLLQLDMLSVDFPSELNGGNWRIRCGDEIMLVTAVDLNAANPVLTVTRAQDGTTIAAHGVGSKVVHVLTAEALTTIIAEAIQVHLDTITDSHDASSISVLDAGDKFTGTEVESVLAELEARIALLEGP